MRRDDSIHHISCKKSVKFGISVGYGLSAKWPPNVQLLSDPESIATAINRTPGSISYLEMDIGNIKHLKFVRIRHPNGSLVKADLGFLRSGIISAQAQNSLKDGNSLHAADLGTNWPIMLPIYVTVPQKASNDEDKKLALKFIFWILNRGDDIIEQSGLVPLPVIHQSKAVKSLLSIKAVNGQPLLNNFDF